MHAVTFVAAIGLVSCGGAPQVSQVAVTQVWARLPVVAGRPAVAYFVVQGGSTPSRLTSVASFKTQRIELHQGGMSGNMAIMRPLDGVDVPAGGKLSFTPGGNHAMIYGLDPAIRQGSALPLTFRFADGRSIEREAQVVSADASAPASR